MRNATFVILVGSLDFGRCPVASRIHRAIWPLLDRPLLEYQLRLLSRQGVKETAVCANGSTPLVREVLDFASFGKMSVRFVADLMPRGAAGSVKDAVGKDPKGPVVVIEGGGAWVADAGELLGAHRRGGGVLTVFTSGTFEKDGSNVTPGGIYVCEPEVLDLVLPAGYQDIKEQIIPSMLKRGMPVRAAAVPGAIIGGRGHEAYLRTVELALRQPEKFGIDLKRYERMDGDVWVAEGATISESARIFGPAAVLEGASVGRGAIIVGPAVVGRHSKLGEGVLVDTSVLWDDVKIGRHACVKSAVIATGARLKAGETLAGRTFARSKSEKLMLKEIRGKRMKASRAQGPSVEKASNAAVRTEPAGAKARGKKTGAKRLVDALALKRRFGYIAGAGLVIAALLWSYASVWIELWGIWRHNDDYSSGILVPFLAAYVVFMRRRKLATVSVRPCYWGLLLVAGGFLMRFTGSMLLFASGERLSLVVVIVGTVVTIFGMRVTRKLAWVLGFLLLMLPWPTRIYFPTSLALQNWATSSAVFVLELLGWVVIREGNVIHVGSATVAVAEACSGLRMLTAFMVVGGLVAFLYGRNRLEKLIIVASSVPIAVLCNTIRLTATAIAFTAGYGARVNNFFHDFGGIAMMPLALAIMTLELWLLKRLFVHETVEDESSRGAVAKKDSR